MRSRNLLNSKLITVLICIGLLSIYVIGCGGSSGGGDDDGDSNIEPQTYTASGTYTYNPDTGVLVLTFTNSNFAGCGPVVGVETKDVDSVTEKTMLWTEDNMLWQRDSGTAGDITGTWDWVDEDGNAYEVNVNADGSMFVIGEIIDCDEGGGGSQVDSITGESGNQVSVVGTWEGICDADAGAGSSEITVITLLETSFTVTSNHWFSSMTCSGTSDATQVINGTFTKGSEVSAQLNGSNVTATKIDIVITVAQGTIKNPAIIGDLNADQECGFDDWVVGVPKNLIGTNCMSQTNQKDIIYIDDTADPDTLYFGDEDGPMDANGYPTLIDLDSEAERI